MDIKDTWPWRIVGFERHWCPNIPKLKYCYDLQFKDVERRSNYELYLKMLNIKGWKDCKRTT